jgi:hypothetical protein
MTKTTTLNHIRLGRLISLLGEVMEEVSAIYCDTEEGSGAEQIAGHLDETIAGLIRSIKTIRAADACGELTDPDTALRILRRMGE